MRTQCCRNCKKILDKTFVDLGMSPLSNAYITSGNLNKSEPIFPLHTYVCDNCFLVQLEEFQTPEQIFSEYAYLSSYSDSWLKHVSNYVDEIVLENGLSEDSLVVEVASNDGYLLQNFLKYNIPVLGVEPAENVAQIARQKGIDTISSFFNMKTAQQIVNNDQMADLVIANNVLAHVPDLLDFVSSLKLILKPEGIITLEFPHLLKLIEQNQFDTIYHEHFSYFSLLTVKEIFRSLGLEIYHVEELQTHGGSLRIYSKHADDGTKKMTESVGKLLEKELQFGLNKIETYFSFTEKVQKTKLALIEFLINLKKEGNTIVGYGAPAKGNTLLNYCGIGKDFLDFTVDRNPVKQGTFLPGTRIPVYGPEAIEKVKPDYILILPWNLKDEIIDQISYVKEWGCKFIVPIPHLQVM